MAPLRLLAILLTLPAAILAVTLQDFPPRLSNLPASCETVYTQDIPQCSSSDFAGNGCSVACINALSGLAGPIKQGCGNQGLEGENIIVAFLADSGVTSVCPNAKALFAAQSSASAAQQQQQQQSTSSTASETATSAAQATSTSAQSTTDSASSTSSSVASSTSAQPSSASGVTSTTTSTTSSGSSAASSAASTSTPPSSSSTGAAVIPVPITSSSMTSMRYDISSSPSMSPTASTTAFGSSQSAGTHSGGGSPFDGQSNGAPTRSATSGAALALVGSAALLLVASW